MADCMLFRLILGEVPVARPGNEIFSEKSFHIRLDLLQTEQQIIYKIAKQEKKQFQENIGKLIKMILEFPHMHEVSEFQTTRRDFGWHQNDTLRWFCKFQQTEGQICLVCLCEKIEAPWENRVFFKTTERCRMG